MFPDRWLPTTFAILPEPFTEQNGMVNSTMKIVRGKVEKAYVARIAQLYTPEEEPAEQVEQGGVVEARRARLLHASPRRLLSTKQYYNPEYYPFLVPTLDDNGKQIGDLVQPEGGTRSS